MSPIFNNALAGASGQGGAPTPTPYSIDRSVRFNTADSSYLSRTPSTAGNRKTWTWSTWLKRCKIGQLQSLTSSANNTILFFQNTDTLNFYFGTTVRTSTQVFRDSSAWYHIVVAFDTPNATAANRLRIYVNGNEITEWTTNVDVTQNLNTTWNAALAHQINANQTSQFGTLYLADFQNIDGQALDPTSFGEYDSNNVWQPKEYTGTYGTNGFHLDFSDNSTAAALGTDTSGNSNTWTVNNISVTAGAGNDSFVDSPTNGTQTDTGAGGEVVGNYATLNLLDSSSAYTLSNGNLNYTHSTSGHQMTSSTIAVNSGKWYVEVTPTALGGTYMQIGITPGNTSNTTYTGNHGYAYVHSGNKQGLTSSSSYGDSYAANDVIGIAFDADGGSLYFYKNGTAQNSGTAAFTSIDTSKHWRFSVSHFNSGTGVVNFGQRPFAYTAPSGFKALCTANLPAPVVAKPSEVMDVKLYTGNGSTQTISGLGFSPDLVWIKSRVNGTDWNVLADTVRGAGQTLYSNTTTAEGGPNYFLSAFTGDGFSVNVNPNDGVNTTNDAYVAWTWDAGSSTVTNTQGSITSQVRANPSAGFSVVTFTGTGTTGTVGHGLGVTPSMIIIKRRDAGANWYVYHSAIGNTGALGLNLTNATITSANFWNNTSPTSTVLTVSSGSAEINANGGTYVLYCFAPVAGYSSFGSYTGNGSADGPFVFTGFRPRWILFKRSDTTAYWGIYDAARNTYNAVNLGLYPNDSLAEFADQPFDFLSNGFKVRGTTAFVNNNAATYVWAAFAEHPFRTARAR